MGTTSSSCLSSSFLQLKEIEIEIGKAAARRTFVEYTRSSRPLSPPRKNLGFRIRCLRKLVLITNVLTYLRHRYDHSWTNNQVSRSLVVHSISRNDESISKSSEESRFEVNRFCTLIIFGRCSFLFFFFFLVRSPTAPKIDFSKRHKLAMVFTVRWYSIRASRSQEQKRGERERSRMRSCSRARSVKARE